MLPLYTVFLERNDLKGCFTLNINYRDRPCGDPKHSWWPLNPWNLYPNVSNYDPGQTGSDPLHPASF